MDPNHSIVSIDKLRPTQMAVGMLLVAHKRKKLREFEKRPAELVDFILEHPIRVVFGPKQFVYVIDHHHLALALLKERFETAPMAVEADYSALSTADFKKKMAAMKYVYPYDGAGKKHPVSQIPKDLEVLEDDPYRSIAGFVREAGGFEKVMTPYAEFVWAEYYRTRIKKKLVKKNFAKAMQQAMELAHDKDAKKLPGFISARRQTNT